MILEFLILAFATVGFIRLIVWLLPYKLLLPWKMGAVLLIVLLWCAIVKAPFHGHWGADHGPLTDFIATAGIILVAVWGVRLVGRNTRICRAGHAIVYHSVIAIVACGLIILIWFPHFETGFPRFTSSPSRTSSTLTRPIAPPENTNRGTTRLSQPHTHVRTLDCRNLSAHGRLSAGCP